MLGRNSFDSSFKYQEHMQPNQKPTENVSVNLKFQVLCEKTTVGQVVVVTGSREELGCWNPIKGVILKTSIKQFPYWFGEINVLKKLNECPTIEYKYVIREDKPGSFYQNWEELTSNRLISLKNVTHLEVLDIFNKQKHMREEIQQLQSPMRGMGPGQAIQEEEPSELSFSSPSQKNKIITKVREFKNVNDYYQQVKKKVISHSSTAPLNKEEDFVYQAQKNVVQGLPELKRKLSNDVQNVDLNATTLRSLDDIVKRNAQLSAHKGSPDEKLNRMLENSANDENEDQASFYSKEQEMRARRASNFLIGTPLNVISSGEDDDNLHDEDDTDEDMDEEEQRLLEEIKIQPTDQLIIASMKLPISVVRDGEGGFKTRAARSLLYPTLFKLREKKNMVRGFWIGWPGVYPQNEQEQHEITKLLKEYDCIPVFFEEEIIEQYLYFHENVLRPLFHNFKGLNDFESQLAKQELWQNYNYVNQVFANFILDSKQENEMIWIHDNYLLLTPTYIKRHDRNASIGFFMHSPFPSSDIYKMFPYRQEVLKSLLLCDLIGFHIFDYARNFYTACRRILGLNHYFKVGGFLMIECFGRNVMLRISHIGVQLEDLYSCLQTDLSQNFKTHILQVANKPIVISSIDRLHPISGLKNKLLAFQRFLREYPNMRQKVCLVQYMVPSDCPKCQNEHKSHQMINQTRQQILKIIQEIKEEYGADKVHYYEQDLSVEERIGLWAATNILLITTLRDGQCLPPQEFVAIKKFLDLKNKSAVILSEFSGCNRALGGILKVNPFNVEEIVKNIDKAINMTNEEKEQRTTIAYNYIKNHSTIQWAHSFLKDLKRAHYQWEKAQHLIIGFGLNQTLIRTNKGFQELKINLVDSEYQRTINRLIIIDQEGVLPMKVYGSNRRQEPSSHLVDVLNEISNDERNTCFVISSQKKNVLHDWYGEKVPKMGLAAENGFFWRWNSELRNEHEWIKLLQIVDFCWIESVKDIMQSYLEKTEGALIEEKESMIVWNYEDTDPDFGNWQAKELSQNLEQFFFSLPIEISHGKKCLEVVPKDLNKNKLVKQLFQTIAKKFPIDFIMYIGDDPQSEKVFSYLNSRKQHNSKYLSGGASVYSCTIGRKATQAKYYLSDQQQVISLLDDLANISHSSSHNRYKSAEEMKQTSFKLKSQQKWIENWQSRLAEPCPIKKTSSSLKTDEKNMKGDTGGLDEEDDSKRRGSKTLLDKIKSAKDEDEAYHSSMNNLSQYNNQYEESSNT